VSQKALDAVLERAMNDAEFRARLAHEPAKALAGYDLTDEERAAFHRGSAHAERLGDRVSKSDLSVSIGVKSSAPRLKTPSQSPKKG
jgi:hypothetical protein